ncbi:hypothetical protein BOW51_11605 [Solemya velesiana gill symbiont]|uniref:Uncharacterized protein n=1 Tax=Solemya velesiana gill symbiont TaxID=1918948 RepID=A0A1T2KQU1_9GAMM|nr:hypothetical protein BOW51_11605 [Solemya velesiana gill symbiont]
MVGNNEAKRADQGIDQSEMGYSIDRLSLAFETSARRWELIVYPSLFAFIILAAYGFYLVYSLAKDVHYLAISVDSNMTVLSSNMQSVSQNMSKLTSNVRTMITHIESIDNKVATLEPMLTNMGSMDQSMKSLTHSTHYMRNDMALMNRNIYPGLCPS